MRQGCLRVPLAPQSLPVQTDVFALMHSMANSTHTHTHTHVRYHTQETHKVMSESPPLDFMGKASIQFPTKTLQLFEQASVSFPEAPASLNLYGAALLDVYIGI